MKKEWYVYKSFLKKTGFFIKVQSLITFIQILIYRRRIKKLMYQRTGNLLPDDYELREFKPFRKAGWIKNTDGYYERELKDVL